MHRCWAQQPADRPSFSEVRAELDQLLAAANQHPALTGVRHNGLADTPQYKLNVDRQEAQAMGISLSQINNTLAVAWGSSYVNDFVDRGRVKRVYVQGDAPFRMLPEDIGDWYVRNDTGEMVPFSAFASGEWIYGSPQLERYNGLSSMNIQGNAAAGYSTGDAMAAMESLAADLPAGIGYEWTGISYEEKQAGGQIGLLLGLSVVVVFLVLAALYESWSMPFIILLSVPLAVLGAVLGAVMGGAGRCWALLSAAVQPVRRAVSRAAAPRTLGAQIAARREAQPSRIAAQRASHATPALPRSQRCSKQTRSA